MRWKMGRPFLFRLGYHLISDEAEAAEQVEFARRLLALPVGSRVLIPYCGYGWHATELAMWGYEVVGIEEGIDLIRSARGRAKALTVSATFFVAQPLNAPFQPESFEGVMVIGNRFGLTGDEASDEQLLQHFRELLKPLGRLVLALPHRDGFLIYFRERDWEPGLTDEEEVLILRQWDAVAGQVLEEWVIVGQGKKRRYAFSYRLYTVTEFERLLRDTGFRLTNVFGDFEGKPLSRESPLMLLQAVRG